MLKYNLFSVVAGVCAATASFLGKLSGHVSDSFVVLASCIGGMIFMNAIMWTFYSKALSLSPTSVGPTVASAATNYLVSGLIGVVIFREATSLIWWSGLGLVLMGLLLISKGSNKQSQP